MDAETRQAVRRVLAEAPDLPHFFDLNDAERLNAMLALAFELGREKGNYDLVDARQALVLDRSGTRTKEKAVRR